MYRACVYTEHGREHNDPPLMRWIDRQASRYTTAVIAVSQRLAGYLEKTVGVARRKIRVIHSGVDTDLFTPGQASAEFRSSLGVPTGAFVIGSLGRLETVKAYEHLLEAAAIIRAKVARPFVVLLCGDGSERASLEAQAQRLGIADIVRMPGWTSEGVETQRLIDVFVLPSRSEGQSVSLMEAMACGAVPVVTDVGANAEMLGPSLRVNSFPWRKPEVLAETLLRMLEPNAPLDAIRAESAQACRRAIQPESNGRRVRSLVPRRWRLARGRYASSHHSPSRRVMKASPP